MTRATYQEFRIYHRTDLVFNCFARHAGEAVEQLAENEGESFEFSDITEIKVATQKDGWVDVPLPKREVIS